MNTYLHRLPFIMVRAKGHALTLNNMSAIERFSLPAPYKCKCSRFMCNEVLSQVVVTCKSRHTRHADVLRQNQKDLSMPDLFKVDAEGLELQVRS